jgi:hypothetical protein
MMYGLLRYLTRVAMRGETHGVRLYNSPLLRPCAHTETPKKNRAMQKKHGADNV